MPNLEIAIEQGKLKGCTLTTQNGFEYNAYMGIPYAKSPVGELRFKDPQYPDKWDGVLDATKEGNDCAQIDTMFGRGFIGSEDGLFLNVYVPNGTPDDEKLPVMFWIHGGAFVMGSGSREMYGVDYLVQAKLVIVTINYRLGPLGFLCCNNTDVPGNAGLKDQTFALRWVQKNIHKFGGDPNNVTIFGESAGGASVHFQMLSPMAKGQFQKVIVQSGSSTCTWAIQSHPEQNVFQLAKELGFDSTDMDATLKFLRQVPVEKLMKCGSKDILDNEQNNFVPIIEQSITGVEAFITTAPVELMKSGNYNRVPCITGVTSQEGVLMLINAKNPEKDFSKVKNLADTGFPLKATLKSEKIDDETADLMVKKIEDFYFGKTSEPVDAYIDLLSDLFFTTDVFRNISLQMKHSPMYVYVLSYNGGLNFFKLLTSYPYTGASHGDELGYLFKQSPREVPKDFEVPKVTDEDIRTIRRLITMWTSFAKYGNPTPKLSGDTIPTIWEPLSPDGEIKCLDIGKEVKMISNPFTERLQFWESLTK